MPTLEEFMATLPAAKKTPEKKPGLEELMATLPAAERPAGQVAPTQPTPQPQQIAAGLAPQTPTPQPQQPPSWLRMGAEMAGATAGGLIGGAAAGIPTMGLGAMAGAAAGAGLGGAMGNQLYDLAMEFLGNKAPETLKERGRGAVEDIAFNVLAGPAGEVVGKVAGAVAGKVLAPGGRAAAERLARFRELGVRPTAGTITQGKMLGKFEKALAEMPFSSGVMGEATESTMRQLESANKFLASEYGSSLTKEEIGELMRAKVAPKALDRLSGVYNKLFSRVSEQIGSNPQAVGNTAQTLRTLVQESQMGPRSGLIKLGEEIIGKAKVNNGLPFEAIKRYRTQVGEMIKNPELLSARNIASGDAKRLYAALSNDMDAAASKAGIKAQASWRAANKYFENTLKTEAPALENIIKKKYDEDAYNIITQGTRLGGSRLRLLKKEMSPQEWGSVSGSVLGKLGVNQAGDFSASTFLSNYNKLAPEAKTALWGGTKYGDLAHSLDNLVTSMKDVRAIEALSNRSKTGSVVAFLNVFNALTGYAAGGIPTSMGALILAPYASAKLVTSKPFVNWLGSGIKIAKVNPNGLANHMGRLAALAVDDKTDSSLKEAIGDLLQKSLQLGME
jgi:hypothetical protein